MCSSAEKKSQGERQVQAKLRTLGKLQSKVLELSLEAWVLMLSAMGVLSRNKLT